VAEERIGELLGRWYDARQAGRDLPPEELCQDCPQLLQGLREGIAKARCLEELRAEEAGAKEEPAAAWQPGGCPVPGYTLLEFCGRGGAGEVWRAVGPGGVHVALKRVALDRPLGEREHKALTGYCLLPPHAHLVSLHGYWVREQEKELVVVTDLATGGSLKDRLGHFQGGIPVGQLLRHMQDAAEGLDFLHDQGDADGWQHRDVKPANLLLFGNSVKVGDFGLAKELRATAAAHSGVGTPWYIPPEAGQDQVHRNSDQYSLAMTYVELRTGERDRQEFQRRYPGEYEVVARALRDDPRRRWESCEEFVARLREASRAAGDEPFRPTPRSETGRVAFEPMSAAPNIQQNALGRKLAQPREEAGTLATPAVLDQGVVQETPPLAMTLPWGKGKPTKGRGMLGGLLIGAGAVLLCSLVVGILMFLGAGNKPGTASEAVKSKNKPAEPEKWTFASWTASNPPPDCSAVTQGAQWNVNVSRGAKPPWNDPSYMYKVGETPIPGQNGLYTPDKAYPAGRGTVRGYAIQRNGMWYPSNSSTATRGTWQYELVRENFAVFYPE
jgi:serine/threonine protein kinase